MREEHVQIDLKPLMELEHTVLWHCGKSVDIYGKDFVPRHFHHQFFELTVVTSGKGAMYVNDEITQVAKGDVFVSFPFEYHRIDSDPDDPMKYVFVSFGVTSPRYEEELKKNWLDNIPPKNRVIRNDRIRELIEQIITEFEFRDRPFFTDTVSVLLDQILLCFMREFSERKPQSLSSTPTDDELCRHIEHYIDTHLYSIGKLSDIGSVMKYNYSYLSSLYSRTVGTTLLDYYQSRRMERAASLLSDRSTPISVIAETLGYGSIYSFSKAFKSYFGVSPSAYLPPVRPAANAGRIIRGDEER